MYNPATARFLQEDTYRGNASIPLSLNLYTYCHNEPIMYRDPTGHWAVGDELLSSGAQKLITKYTSNYYAAEAKGDTAGMQKAEAQANALRETERNNASTQNITPAGLAKTNAIQSSNKVDSGGKFITADTWSTVSGSGSSSSNSVKPLPSYSSVAPAPVAGNVRQSNSTSGGTTASSSANISTGQISTSVNVTVGGVSIGNTALINGVAYANAAQLAAALKFSKTAKNKKNHPIYSNGSYNFMATMKVGGDFVLPVLDMANASIFRDTVSLWEGKNGYNILVQPDMVDAPVQVTRMKDQINIKAYLDFTGDWNTTHVGYGASLAELFTEGVTKQWSGSPTLTSHDDFGIYSGITVNVSVFAKQTSNNGTWIQDTTHANYQEVNFTNNPGSSTPNQYPFVGGGSWSYLSTGVLFMFVRDSRNTSDYSKVKFKEVSGHEFGHIMGLGDAYGWMPGDPVQKVISSDNRSRTPKSIETDSSAMQEHNPPANANDVEMVLEAYRTNQKQHFVTYIGFNGTQYTQSSVIGSYK